LLPLFSLNFSPGVYIIIVQFKEYAKRK